MSDNNFSQQLQSIWKIAKRYCTLQLNYAKLTFAEKLAVLLSGIAVVAVCFFLVSFMLLLLSFSLIDVLKETMPAYLAYLIVCGIFAVLTIVVVVCRKSLIINPISRFISKLFFDKKL